MSPDRDDAALFRAIFNTGSAGFAEVDVASGCYLRANRRFCEMTGREEAALRRLGPADIVHPDDLPILAAFWGEEDPDRASRDADLRYLRPDGELRWARVSLSISARDAVGRPLRRLAVVQDITETRRMAEQARAREALLRLSLEYGRIGTFRRDHRTGMVDPDAEARAVHGLPPGEGPLDQEAWVARLLPEDVGDLARQIGALNAALLAQGSFRYRLRRPGTNEIRHIEARARYEYAEDGRPLQAIGVVIDVTEQREAEERRQASEALLRLTLQAARIGTFRRDPATGRFEADAAAAAMQGLAAEGGSFSPEAWVAALVPADRAAIRARIDGFLAAREPEGAFDFRVRAPGGGGVRHIEARASHTYDEAGRPRGSIGVLIDVTERRLAEERLREREALLRLSLSIGNIGTYRRDHRAGTITCGPETRSLHGLPPGEAPIPEQTWFEMVLRPDRARLRAELGAAIAARQQEIAYEYRYRNPVDGTVHHMEARTRFEYDSEGHPVRSTGVVIDVTDRRMAEARLREREAELRLSLAGGNIGTYRRDMVAGTFECGPEARALLGLPEGEEALSEELWFDLMLPEDRGPMRRRLEKARAHCQTEIAFEYRIRRPCDGEIRHVEVRARYAYDEAGQPISSHGVVIDVTERWQSSELLRLCLEIGGIGEFRHDFRTDLVTAGAKARELYGLPQDDAPIAARDWFAAILPEDRARLRVQSGERMARRARDNGGFDYRIRHLQDGRIRHLEARVRYEYDPDGEPLSAMGVVIDVTDRREAEERLVHIARHDPLTGLPNRLLFREGLDAALAEARRGRGFALHCLDLDRFKEVNDTLGHPVGDALLREVAERVRGVLRETDTLARLGGDEFAVIQKGAEGREAAERLARRIVEVLARPFDLGGHQVGIGTSLGIAFAPGDAVEADVLMRDADMALYRAKAEGRGRWSFFDPEMDARMQLRRALELELRRALAGEEFELHYQPIVDVRTGGPCGFEALMRWRHPERGMIPPDGFISLCEDIGLIVALGEWALLRACRDATTWPGSPRVAVNLSPSQFATSGLVEAVARALAISGLDPARLELEVTETVMLGDADSALAALQRLKALGVRIALDDFGTGYSSLSHLQRFPVDKVKIDRCFTSELGLSARSRAIVEAVTRLCDGLAMTTTAEGVETPAQLEAIRGIGCVEAQGYLFSHPVPAAEVPRLLARLWRHAAGPGERVPTARPPRRGLGTTAGAGAISA